MGKRSAEFVASLPVGRRVWLRGLGRSMSPVLRSGDSLRVERCLPSTLRRGEIAVLRSTGDRLIAHLVIGTSPLRSSTFLGLEDPDGAEVLGRVIAVRRDKRRIRLFAESPSVLWWLHRVTAAAEANRSIRRVRGWVGALSRFGPG